MSCGSLTVGRAVRGGLRAPDAAPIVNRSSFEFQIHAPHVGLSSAPDGDYVQIVYVGRRLWEVAGTRSGSYRYVADLRERPDDAAAPTRRVAVASFSAQFLFTDASPGQLYRLAYVKHDGQVAAVSPPFAAPNA